MRPGLTFGITAALLMVGARATAAPGVDIRSAAARIIVVPEARRDIAVSVLHADSRLPIRIRKLLDHVYLSGDVARGGVRGCRSPQGARMVSIWGRGSFAYEQLPLIVIRTPPAVHLSGGDAVFGEIQRSQSVDFTNRGCGDWTIGDVRDRLRLNQAGAGDSSTGSANSAFLSVAGSGGIAVGAIRDGLMAVSSGSGDITVADVSGPVDARVAGPGNIVMASGSVTTLSASIAGSGAVVLRGVAGRLNASIAGKGDVSVAKVTGAVRKQVFGAGAVHIGR